METTSTKHRLQRVAYQGEDSAHWALVLPFKTGDEAGIFVDIAVRKDKTLKPVDHVLRIQKLHVVDTLVTEARVITGAVISERQLREAADAVFYREGNSYHMLTNNCQHFCLDVVTWLHQHYPNSVSAAAVKECAGKGTVPIAVRKFIHWTRLTKEGREAKWKERQAKSARESSARPSSKSSNQARISIE